MPRDLETGRWLAGRSGNPAGRPALPRDLRAALRAYAPEAVQLLGRSMGDPALSLAVRLACAARLAALAARVPDVLTVGAFDQVSDQVLDQLEAEQDGPPLIEGGPA